jgi:hypothetical protein
MAYHQYILCVLHSLIICIRPVITLKKNVKKDHKLLLFISYGVCFGLAHTPFIFEDNTCDFLIIVNRFLVQVLPLYSVYTVVLISNTTNISLTWCIQMTTIPLSSPHKIK